MTDATETTVAPTRMWAVVTKSGKIVTVTSARDTAMRHRTYENNFGQRKNCPHAVVRVVVTEEALANV